MATEWKTMAVEYIATTKIGEKGQLTVPKQFRDELGLGLGAPFSVLRMGDGLILLPEQRRFEQMCARVTEALTRGGATPEILATRLPKARKRVFIRRYRALAAELPGPSRRRNRVGQ